MSLFLSSFFLLFYCSEGRSLEGLGSVTDVQSASSSAVLKDPANFSRLETDMVLVVRAAYGI